MLRPSKFLILTIMMLTLIGLGQIQLQPAQAEISTPALDLPASHGDAVVQADEARVRVVHASPDAPNVDVLVDDAVAFSDIAFEEITDYADLPPGTYNIKVVPAGASEPVVIEADLDLSANTDYTVVAVGELADIEPLVLVDDNSPPTIGEANVRFVHASPNAPAVDVAVADGGPVLFSNFEFKESSDYVGVTAGTYDLEVRLAGTSDVVLELPGVTLEASATNTVFATGLVAETPLTAVASLDSEAEARVRVAHLSPDTGGVDIFVDDQLVASLSHITFETVTDYVTLPPGTYNVKVVPTGNGPDHAVLEADLTLEADTDYTVAAVGLSHADPSLEALVLVDDNSAPAEGQANVRFVHASPNAPAVDVAVTAGPVLFDGFEFKESSEYLGVDAGTYDLEVRLAGTSDVVLSLPGVELEAGKVYTVFATGLVGDDDTPLNAVLTVDAEATAQVRVAHASPDAPNVDVLVNDGVAFPNIPFQDVTDYAPLPPDSYNVKVVPAGEITPVVIEADLELAADTDYTVVAVGRLADIEPLPLVDDNSAPAEGEAKVRFVHASPNAPEVDVALQGGAVLFDDFEFKEASAYLGVAAGTYDLEVRVAETGDVVLPLPGVEFEAGKTYTIFAEGLVSETPLNAIVGLDRQGESRVRVVHASPDAPNVDVLVNDGVAFSNIAFEAITDYASLTPGTYNIKVVPTGATEPVVIEADLPLADGVDYTIVAVGELANIEPLVLEDDNSVPADGQAKVRFVHASPNAPAVDVAVTDGPVLFSNVSFKEATDYIEVAAGTYDLEVRLAGTTDVVLSLPGVEFEAGGVYTVFATGLVGDDDTPLDAIIGLFKTANFVDSVYQYYLPFVAK